MIRRGDTADIIPCTSMAAQFWTHTRYEDPFDAEHVAYMFTACQRTGVYLVLEVDGAVVGFIAGLAMPLLGNRHVLQVTELAYWIQPDHRGHGVQLLQAFQDAARERGAKYLNMISLESSMPDVVRRLYESQGFEHSETVFTKQLIEEATS